MKSCTRNCSRTVVPEPFGWRGRKCSQAAHCVRVQSGICASNRRTLAAQAADERGSLRVYEDWRQREVRREGESERERKREIRRDSSRRTRCGVRVRGLLGQPDTFNVRKLCAKRFADIKLNCPERSRFAFVSLTPFARLCNYYRKLALISAARAATAFAEHAASLLLFVFAALAVVRCCSLFVFVRL